MNATNVILTIYYTKSPDPQRNIYQKSDNFLYIKKFYDSVIRNNMSAVIFHDGVSDDFIQKYQTDNIKFAPLPDKAYGLTSMNDIRFMVYLDYLLEHKSVEKVIISDIADVEFYDDIFNDIVENKLYVFHDRDRTFEHYYLKNRINLTYGNLEPFNDIMNCKATQAGLFAGSSEMIVKCLKHMEYEFNNLVDKTCNTNYIVYNHVIYSHMLDDCIFAKNGHDVRTKCATSVKYLTIKSQ